MSISSRSGENISGYCRYVSLVILTFCMGLTGSVGQAATSPKSAGQQSASGVTAPKPQTGKGKAGTGAGITSEAPGVLVQLTSALESLAARVSPAVVQILVTGYGPLHEEDKSQTALIVSTRWARA